MSRQATQEEIAMILKSPAYQPWVLIEYTHWRVYLDARDQSLFGRAYAWLTTRHEDRMQIHRLNRTELDELIYRVIPLHEAALARRRPLLTINAEWQGNETHLHRGHGHMHLLPRYCAPFTFALKTFTDPAPNKRHVKRDMNLTNQQLLDIATELRDCYARITSRAA